MKLIIMKVCCRLDIPGDGFPTAKLYKTINGVDSAAVQSTTLPNNVLPLLKVVDLWKCTTRP